MSQPVDNSRVVVSTPQYGCVSQIRRAVDGVLGQTHRNLQLVVVNCGDPESPWDELADMEDPRLVRFELFENRGPYFAHQVVLQATEADYFVVQDADDWSEPPRVAMLLRALRQRHAVAAVSLDRQHHVNGRVADSQPLNPRQAPGPDLTHWANHHALFRVDALRAIGGYDAGFQLGYDTLLMSLLAMIGPIAQVDCVLYHRHHRPDSLTHHPTTGFGSERRNQAIAELRQLHDRVYAEYERYLAGGIGRERLMESMVAAVGEASDRERKDAIAAHALRLRAALAQANGRANGQADGRVDGQLGQHSSFRMCPVRVGVQGSLQAPAAASVCTERLRTSWSMEPEALDALLQRIAELRPRRMLELGSGVSTLCLAKYARDHQITFQSLEHDEDYLRRTRDVLRSERLDPYVELTHAPVQRVRCAGLELQGYDFQRVEGEFGFVLMDGPPCSIGREANYFLLRPHLAASHELWLHDGYRLHELNCLELWQTHHRFSAQLRPYGDSGMWVIRSSVDTAPRQAAMPVGVSLLTGGRPELLSRTIAALQARAPWLLAEHFVQVVINGADDPTCDYVSSLDFVDDCVVLEGARMPIGPATSLAVLRLLKNVNVEYVLHLEDDWEASGADESWLARAGDILERSPMVGQVRLRDRHEPVATRHALSGSLMEWRLEPGYLLAESAHFTFNPGLIRAADARRIFPCQDEREAQANFFALGLQTAQLTPGTFRHIGGGQSLRERLLDVEKHRFRQSPQRFPAE